ncbi:MAG TPA: DUF305 domain-containing protein [Candidatus Paceibacterota bacterium]|nr:DUF305 domain-containing protein [Candidatus Paceibacterota bacterium]
MTKNSIGFLFLLAGLVLGYVLYPTFHKKSTPVEVRQMPNDEIEQNTQMSMRQMTDGMEKLLVGKKDATFDEAFLQAMITHHQGAIAMARQVLVSTRRPELLKLAQEIITAQEREVQQMQEWQAKWFGVHPY